TFDQCRFLDNETADESRRCHKEECALDDSDKDFGSQLDIRSFLIGSMDSLIHCGRGGTPTAGFVEPDIRIDRVTS
ncbi:MAG: hypothetical protein KC994_10745, partial [Candidatus Omnitrophica bacterium]|nr:hypothetical protein [Candidatus Omnitrophota bacterium]